MKSGAQAVSSSIAWVAIAIGALYSGATRSETMLDKLQPEAVKVAQLRGAEELGCAGSGAQVLKRQVVEEGATTGWSDIPSRAEYLVAVSGCGKQRTYLVVCDRWQGACTAGAPPAAPAARPAGLADELQPAALAIAQGRGHAELECPAASAAVLRKETIEDGQTTGWYDPPHQAVFRIDVSGCGKSRQYLVSCDNRKKSSESCVAVAFQQAAQQQHSVSRLADEMQPSAVAAARQRGASEFACADITASVAREETIEEAAPTTGWYEPPHRVVYRMDVAGCGKRATYFVACDHLRKGDGMCKVGTLAQSTP